MDPRERNFRNAYKDFQRAAVLDGETDIIGDPDYGVGRRHLLFVYGTMMDGYRNHARIAGKAKFVRTAVTAEARYDLFTKKTSYTAPVMVRRNKPGYLITGEVYEVTGPLLSVIDGFEGHPSVYERERILVQGVQGFVWAYLFKREDSTVLSDRGIELTGIRKTFRVME